MHVSREDNASAEKHHGCPDWQTSKAGKGTTAALRGDGSGSAGRCVDGPMAAQRQSGQGSWYAGRLLLILESERAAGVVVPGRVVAAVSAPSPWFDMNRMTLPHCRGV
jgi:hypothetical protein